MERKNKTKSRKASVLDKKIFVLDTNILLSDPEALSSFQENIVIVPLVTLEELDRHKKRQDEIGRNARLISRRLDELREIGDLRFGVSLPNGGIVKVLSISECKKFEKVSEKEIPEEIRDLEKVDNAIIYQTSLLSSSNAHCTLVSKDINVRIKCDALGIKCEDYFHMRVSNDTSELYKGVKNIIVSENVIADWYENKEVFLDERGLYPNEWVVMKTAPDSSASAIGRFIEERKPLQRLTEYKDIFGLKPRNKEQNFSLNLLLDDEVKLVTLIGSSGVGKTLLALSAGLKKVLEEQKYERIIVTKPVQPVGKDIGFLPGSKEEKMDPWIAPIKDNLMYLFASKKFKKDGQVHEFKRDPYLDKLIHDGKIEVEAITYLRGRSIPNTFMIIDEAQNLSMHELKTIITRVGDNTKIVLLGDIDQIDNIHVDAFTNGLTCAVEKFKEHGIAGHITLIKGERSPLATLASQIL